MVNSLLKTQSAVLAAGTAFSWYTLVDDYRLYFAAGGEWFQWSGCSVTNPMQTACFYGAIAFLIALVWSLGVLAGTPNRVMGRQRGLNWLLAAATVFAWSSFAWEMFAAANHQPAPKFSCPPLPQAPVQYLDQPCFYGALMFLAALMISQLVLRTEGPARRRRSVGHALRPHG